MSAALVAVVLALLASHALPALAGARRFGPFQQWQAGCDARFGAASLPAALLGIVLPALLLAGLHALLANSLLGLPAFVLAVLVLFWCWGPRDLDRDIDDWLAGVEPRAGEAARELGLDVTTPVDGPRVVEALFSAGRRRWFGPLLWFLLLGPAGALLYRLADLAGAPTSRDSALFTLRLLLDWPVAQLMTLALAIAGSFDAVATAWRDWHRARGGFWAADLGFLSAAARASVVFELVTEDQLDPGHAVVSPVLAAARDALSLLWRILIVWLLLVAVLVLGGFVA